MKQFSLFGKVCVKCGGTAKSAVITYDPTPTDGRETGLADGLCTAHAAELSDWLQSSNSMFVPADSPNHLHFVWNGD